MAFYLLALSILCVFPFCKIVILRQPIWQYLMLLSVIVAYYQKYINLNAVAVIAVYVGLFHFFLFTYLMLAAPFNKLQAQKSRLN